MEEIRKKLKDYYQKLYSLKLIRGFIITLGLALALLMALVILEYFLWLPSQSRSVMWFSFLGIIGLSVLVFMVPSILELLGLRRTLQSENLAKLIGKELPQVDDKLLNLLELERLGKADAALVKAAIEQKAAALSVYDFKEVLQWKNALRLWPVLAVPVLAYLLLWLSGNSEIFTTGSERLRNYEVAYERELPFEYVVSGQTNLEQGQDLNLQILLNGEVMPEEVFAETPFGKRRLLQKEKGKWHLALENMQESMTLQFKTRQFDMGAVQVEVMPIPRAGDIIQEVMPPTYTGLKPATYSFQRRLEIPEGSALRFVVKDFRADSLAMEKRDGALKFDAEGSLKLNDVLKPIKYEILGFLGALKKPLSAEANIEVIMDQYPKIEAVFSQNDAQPNSLYIESRGSDDYGLQRVAVLLRDDKGDSTLRGEYVSGDKVQQTWRLDLNEFSARENVSVVVAVWDNDQVNGSKRTLSTAYKPTLLSTKEKQMVLDSAYSGYQKVQDQMIKESKKIKDALKQAMRSMADDNNLSWEEKESLAQYIEEYKKKLKQLAAKKNKLKDKEKEAKEVKELLEKSDEAKEIEKLLKELEDLLNKEDLKELRKKLNELDKKNEAFERNMGSEEELLKEMKFQRDVLKEMERLEKMSKEAKKTAEQIKDSAKGGENTKERIEGLQKEMEEHSKKMEELKKHRDPLAQEEREKYEEADKKAKESLSDAKNSEESGAKKKGSKEMEESGESMQKMKQQMQNSLMDMQMKMQKENLEALRAILENLEVYSHGIEEMGQQTKGLDRADPGFRDVLLEKKKLELGQKVIEDSLTVLAERAPEIEAKVFEELGNMKSRLAKSIEHLQETEFGKSAGNDQFSMMAANNLAVMLDASMQQMQMNLAAMMKSNANCNKPGGGKPGGKKKSGKQGEIGKKIESLKQGNKPGKGLSKELMQIMKEQEQLRQALSEEEGKSTDQESGKKEGGQGSKGDISEMMEEIEKELAKGNLNFEYKERVQRIQTRLLENERAKRKQGQQEERKAERNTNLQQREADDKNRAFELQRVEEELMRRSLRLKNFYY